MKKLTTILLSALIFTAICTGCSSQNANDSTVSSKETSSINTSSITSDIESSTAISSQTPSSDVTISSESKTPEVSSDYLSWTYVDWKNANDSEKGACNQKFSSELGRTTDVSNLGKIFATNQDKNLSQIITIQKETASTESGVQPDPGHGAAAGEM